MINLLPVPAPTDFDVLAHSTPLDVKAVGLLLAVCHDAFAGLAVLLATAAQSWQSCYWYCRQIENEEGVIVDPSSDDRANENEAEPHD